MDLSNIGIFALAEKRLAWLDKRQELLAANIANANTPHWQARDLAPFAASLSRAGAGTLAKTQPGHLPGTAGGDGGGDAATSRPAARAPDGNAVSLDEQLMKVADTETTQETVTNLYTKYMGLFRLALGHGT